MFKKHLINGLILLPFIWLFSGVMIYKDGTKAMVVMTIISIIMSVSTYKLMIIKENIKNNPFLWSIILMTFYAIIAKLTYGFNSNEFRALLCSSLLMLTFPKNLLTKKILIRLTLLASVCSLIFIYYNYEYLGLDRSTASINAIPYATACAAISVISFNLLFISKKITDKIFCTTSLIITIGAVISLETRGIWLALFVTLFVSIIIKIIKYGLPWKLTIITTAITLLLIFTYQKDIEQRIQQTNNELVKIQSNDLNTSIGLRLQMWKLAPKMINGDLLFGTGEKQINKFDQLYHDGFVSKALYAFQPPHYHNQYIDNTIKGGLIGLSLLLLLLLTPFVNLKNKSNFYKSLTLSLVLLYSIAGLTDVPFLHGQTLLFYIMIIIVVSNIKDEKLS